MLEPRGSIRSFLTLSNHWLQKPNSGDNHSITRPQSPLGRNTWFLHNAKLKPKATEILSMVATSLSNKAVKLQHFALLPDGFLVIITLMEVPVLSLFISWGCGQATILKDKWMQQTWIWAGTIFPSFAVPLSTKGCSPWAWRFLQGLETMLNLLSGKGEVVET